MLWIRRVIKVQMKVRAQPYLICMWTTKKKSQYLIQEANEEP
jgi:hypothetical protein